MSNTSETSTETQKKTFELVQWEKWPFQVSIMHNGKVFADLSWASSTAWRTKEDANKGNAETLRLANAMIATLNANWSPDRLARKS